MERPDYSGQPWRTVDQLIEALQFYSEQGCGDMEVVKEKYLHDPSGDESIWEVHRRIPHEDWEEKYRREVICLY